MVYDGGLWDIMLSNIGFVETITMLYSLHVVGCKITHQKVLLYLSDTHLKPRVKEEPADSCMLVDGQDQVSDSRNHMGNICVSTVLIINDKGPLWYNMVAQTTTFLQGYISWPLSSGWPTWDYQCGQWMTSMVSVTLVNCSCQVAWLQQTWHDSWCAWYTFFFLNKKRIYTPPLIPQCGSDF